MIFLTKNKENGLAWCNTRVELRKIGRGSEKESTAPTGWAVLSHKGLSFSPKLPLGKLYLTWVSQTISLVRGIAIALLSGGSSM
jgi:hypothetical protein